MEFWITIIGLLRRKWVIIPALLIATACGALAFFVTPVTYVSTATMVVTTPAFGGTESQDPSLPTDLTNPMLNFNDSLTTTSAILIGAMNTKDVAKRLGADADGPTTLVIDDGRTNPDLLGLNGPFLYIVGRSTSPDEAVRVVRDAQVMLRESLRERQAALSAPKKTFVTLVDVVPVSAPEINRWQPTKLGLVALALGFGLSMGTAYLRHQIRARRLTRTLTQPVTTDDLPPEGTSRKDTDRTDPLARRPGRETGRAPAPSPVLVPGRRENDVRSTVRPASSKEKVRSGEQ